MEHTRYIIRAYKTPTGRIPLEDWLRSLKSPVVEQRIRRRFQKLAIGDFGDTKVVAKGIKELRFHFGAGYRVYYAQVEEITVLLLCGGDKSKQSKDIAKAQEYAKEFRARHFLDN